MELISQHTKKIMEECKVRARAAGLRFDDETLEYIVTNKDLLELSPKVMIPTLYDYWVNDVEVLKEQGKYKLYPSNPYETVINSRPAISFYNDNNPDWLNIMIFYHVLGHIDFFQNNAMFANTWNDDFVGQALADKRLIASLRSEHGRWVDYIIEFSRSIDNIVGYFPILAKINQSATQQLTRTEYYFNFFLQEELKVQEYELYKEVERFNSIPSPTKEIAESIFFADVKAKHPEFQAKYERHLEAPSTQPVDLMQYILDHSSFINKEKNRWMKSVVSVIRNTSLYFQPQIRTKIANEGWASYWHDELFRSDDRIKGHEVAYAKLNAGVTSISRIGLNPYAIGLRLIQQIEKNANKGKLNFNFQKIDGIDEREKYDMHTGKGREAIFSIRRDFSDFMLINTFVDQDFVDDHGLFVTGKRLNQQRGMVEYYVKSRKAKDYKKMLLDSLYHPPKIDVDTNKSNDEHLYLIHRFEGKQLYNGFIPDTMLGISVLWGGSIQLETTEIHAKKSRTQNTPEFEYKKVVYTIKDRKITKDYL
ncbi:MAG: SpoVR family protein [Bacteroidota bacterium]